MTRKSLEEMMAESAGDSSEAVKCPKCHCRDFRVYATTHGKEATFRWKKCRHCGHKIVTSTLTSEKIVRDVAERDPPESLRIDSYSA